MTSRTGCGVYRGCVPWLFIVLYNTYGFGYALGMNYRNPQGRREMLWPQNVDKLAVNGHTANGWRIAGAGKENSHVVSDVP